MVSITYADFQAERDKLSAEIQESYVSRINEWLKENPGQTPPMYKTNKWMKLHPEGVFMIDDVPVRSVVDTRVYGPATDSGEKIILNPDDPAHVKEILIRYDVPGTVVSVADYRDGEVHNVKKSCKVPYIVDMRELEIPIDDIHELGSMMQGEPTPLEGSKKPHMFDIFSTVSVPVPDSDILKIAGPTAIYLHGTDFALFYSLRASE